MTRLEHRNVSIYTMRSSGLKMTAFKASPVVNSHRRLAPFIQVSMILNCGINVPFEMGKITRAYLKKCTVPQSRALLVCLETIRLFSDIRTSGQQRSAPYQS
ncbi:hypothetical protein Pst134EB_025112 [Puccinia striiformis f. sp. tritici]|nr:hypothetical protein Pst134EB_025112 [Puccinia striiformis f. sp. tritici]